jgi:two-component system chemotaxis response regulator CheB
MAKIEVFVIGGSAGALNALAEIAPRLPPDFPAPICIILHVAADSPGMIPEILSMKGPLPARHAEEGEPLLAGQIRVAPPDHHLLIDAERKLRLGRGPKENRFRPAIDPLFRSAALTFANRAGGVLLSGGLDDGVAGLAAIWRRGGAAIVQDPLEASVPSMPSAALRVLAPDRVLPAAPIAAAMIEFVRERHAPAARESAMTDDLKKENQFAMGADSDLEDIRSMGEASLMTCPDCHGAMVRLRDAVPERFRCHTGHAFTLETMLAAQRERVESSLWSAVRALEEQAALLEHFAGHLTEEEAAERRKAALHEASEAQWRSRLVRDAVRPKR